MFHKDSVVFLEGVEDSKEYLQQWLDTPTKVIGLKLLRKGTVLRVARLLSSSRKFGGVVPQHKEGNLFVSPWMSTTYGGLETFEKAIEMGAKGTVTQSDTSKITEIGLFEIELNEDIRVMATRNNGSFRFVSSEEIDFFNINIKQEKYLKRNIYENTKGDIMTFKDFLNTKVSVDAEIVKTNEQAQFIGKFDLEHFERSYELNKDRLGKTYLWDNGNEVEEVEDSLVLSVDKNHLATVDRGVGSGLDIMIQDKEYKYFRHLSIYSDEVKLLKKFI